MTKIWVVEVENYNGEWLPLSLYYTRKKAREVMYNFQFVALDNKYRVVKYRRVE